MIRKLDNDLQNVENGQVDNDRCPENCDDKCKIKNIAFLQYEYGTGSTAKEKSDISNSVSICVKHNNDDDDNPRFSVIKDVNKDVTEPGDTLTYKVYVTNTGDGSLSEVELIDQLDSDTNYVTGSAKVVLASTNAPVDFDTPVYDSNTHRLTITVNDELPEGDTFIFSYDVLVDDEIDDITMLIANHATVTTAEADSQDDATEIAASFARVTIEKEIVYPENVRCVKCNDRLVYEIRVRHSQGTIPARDLVITDLFDSEFCFDEDDVTVSPAAGSDVTVVNGLLTVTIDELAVGRTVTITVDGKICCCERRERE